MRQIICLLMLVTVIACQKASYKSIQRIAENNAREFLLKNINDPNSYSPIEFSKLDTSLVLGFLLEDQVFTANFDSFIKTGDIGYSVAMDARKDEMIVNIVNLLSNYSTNHTFKQAMDSAIVKKNHSPLDFVALFGKTFIEIEPNAGLAAIFNTVNLKDKIAFNSTNEEVLEVIREEIKYPKFILEHSFRAKNGFGALMLYKYNISFDKTITVIDVQELPE